ncbi:MAG: hypothetical protein NTX75_06325 [Proteobacteria bacterium]|nr:hypothetical protein [Pseudomonadota bacterium]
MKKIAPLLTPYGKVFLYSVDPGAYAIMRPIYELLLSTGGETQWIVDGWCRNAIECEYPFTVLSSFKEDFCQINLDGCCMLLGSQTNFEATHNTLRFCKEKGIATIFLFDHWGNYLSHFHSPIDNSLYLPDKICVPDEIGRQTLCAELLPLLENERYANNIQVVGHPAIENSVNAICSMTTSEIEIIKRRLIPVDKRIVLFLLEPIEDGLGYNSDGTPFLGYNEYSVLRYILSLPDFDDVQMIIKPHPRQDIEKIKMFLLPYAHRDILLVENEKLENLIAIADEVLGMTTIALIIALKAGKKIRSVQVGRNERGKNLHNPYFEENIVL